jgi:REP element-mobilizing transposase RayT
MQEMPLRTAATTSKGVKNIGEMVMCNVETHIRSKPPRLNEVFQSHAAPLYFVTFCTMCRVECLATSAVHDAFRQYAGKAQDHGVAVGRYVIMPDHVHLFVRMGGDYCLGEWVKGLKRFMGTVCLGTNRRVWQPGFFDHLLRHGEGYAEKWAYVVQNPVRRGLVTDSSKWPYQGEICVIDRV